MSADKSKLALAINAALSSAGLSRQREALLFAGEGSLDTKRPMAWCEWGWPENPDFKTFYRLYRRGGIAHGTVCQLLDKCWQTDPWVIEGTEAEKATKTKPWEAQVKTFLDSIDFWYYAKEADRRRMVGRYSGLIMQIADSKKFKDPAVPGGRIVKLIPAWEGQLKVSSWYDDETDAENYGEPKEFTFTENAIVEGGPSRNVTVHPSRVLIFGDLKEGQSLLEPGLNAFINLEKVEGGSAESLLKNSARQLSVNFDKDVKLDSLAAMYGVPVKDLADGFNEAVSAINRAQDAALITQGAQVSTLTAQTPDPKEAYSLNLQTASASVMIPTRIIAGSQSGERATVEDLKSFNQRGQGRRTGLLARDLTGCIDRFIELKQIDAKPQFKVMWDNLTDFTKAERLEASFKMSDINAKMLPSGEPVFTVEELREAAGYENDAELPDVPEDEGGAE